jgi:hypothetical protein
VGCCVLSGARALPSVGLSVDRSGYHVASRQDQVLAP